MEQERRERRKRAKIFFVVGMLLLLFIMAMVGIFPSWSSWRPALGFSVMCFVMLVFYIYMGLRWYSRVTK